MNKLILALCLTIITSVFAVAQDPTDGYKKGEFFIGYSNGQIGTGLGDIDDEEFGIDIDERETFHGFNTSGVYNVSRYFGVKADVSGVYNDRDFSFTVPTTAVGGGTGTGTVSFESKNSLYNFLGGVQIKDNSRSGRFKPFAHALVGAAHARTKISNVVCPIGVDCSFIVSGSETGWAGAFGGGIDVRLNKSVQLRAIQVDYNPVWLDGARQNNIRLGVGLVF